MINATVRRGASLGETNHLPVDNTREESGSTRALQQIYLGGKSYGLYVNVFLFIIYSVRKLLLPCICILF